MKTRKIVSIILCTVFLLLSLAVFALMKVINTGATPESAPHHLLLPE